MNVEIIFVKEARFKIIAKVSSISRTNCLINKRMVDYAKVKVKIYMYVIKLLDGVQICALKSSRDAVFAHFSRVLNN